MHFTEGTERKDPVVSAKDETAIDAEDNGGTDGLADSVDAAEAEGAVEDAEINGVEDSVAAAKDQGAEDAGVVGPDRTVVH
jgi:hypothetical protein